jgi:hypothetical protein
MSWPGWITDDTDALTETCYLEVYSAGTGDPWGVGGLDNTPTLTTLECMEVPPRQVLDREHGVLVTVPMQLLIKDTSGIVEPESSLQYNSQQYKITQLTRQEETYTLVVLKKV